MILKPILRQLADQSRPTAQYKKIHFVGIKGVGMTPLAIIAKEAGIDVSGSDIASSFITDKPLSRANIIPITGFAKKNVIGADLVITTGAHGGFDNVEVKEAKRLNIDILTQGQAVGIFMEGTIFGRKLTGISVTGTHGKTTTTAMIATIFKENSLDPSYLVGTGDVVSLRGPGHYGKGEFFIAEADEYATEPNYDRRPKFLWQHPKIAVITNIDFDHPDVYKDLDDVVKAFTKFANTLPKEGVLIICGDSSETKKLLLQHKGKRITYGFSKNNDFVISNVKFSNGKFSFSLDRNGEKLGEFNLNVFGQHNALNATASVITSLELGLSIAQIKKSLLEFRGTKRRSEYVGRLRSGALIFDDYAHHPTEIKKTLTAFKENFKNSKIICIFQPHTYSRTKSLFEEFGYSFNDAYTVIVTNIYSSLRERIDPTISAEILKEEISRSHKDVLFLPEFKDVIEYIDKKSYGRDVIIITMGAGDIYKISEKLIYE